MKRFSQMRLHQFALHVVTVSGGKRDEKLILPINDSLSVTLSTSLVSQL